MAPITRRQSVAPNAAGDLSFRQRAAMKQIPAAFGMTRSPEMAMPHFKEQDR